MNPADATRCDQLGAAFFVAHELARRDEEPGTAWQPVLARQLPQLRTPATALAGLQVFRLHEGPEAEQLLAFVPSSADELSHPEAEQRLTALRPVALGIIDSLLVGLDHDPARPPWAGPGGEVAMYISSLATARAGLDALRGRLRSYPVPAAPRPRPELPARHRGPIELVHVVDLAHPGSLLALEEGDEPFDELVAYTTQRFMHGVDPDDPRSLRAAQLAEAVARAAPDQFWDQARALCETCKLDDPRGVADLLTLEASTRARVLALADTPELHAAVMRDSVEARACGVPSTRPAVCIGTDLFTTVDLPELDLAVWRAAGVVPPGLSWSGLLRLRPSGLAFIHTVGSANDPGDPFGAERLALAADGRLELSWSHRGETGERRGRCSDVIIAEVFELLSRSPFPDLPQLPPRPGPSGRAFELRNGERSAMAMLPRALESKAPYKWLCMLIDSLTAQLRGRSVHPARDPIPGAVEATAPAGPA